MKYDKEIIKLNYRPEIDGLRAIAVSAVILYHAQIIIFGDQFFKGGFIGVDIFFVISGYLITSIILKELISTGSFSFKYFYQRRVRRILPALLFVMLATLPFAWLYLLPSAFMDFSKSILYSLGFSSNFYFWYSGQQYGAESGLLKPFLHTWSLSVEEQYYIIFPIIFFITFKYFKKYLIHILITGFLVSLGLADWASKNYSSLNFYILPTRAWELLVGSILSYFEFTKRQTKKNGILNLILPSIGMLIIGHSIIFFNDKMFHPSFYTLSPIIGVSLIIWFSNKDELITKILSTKLFVKIGLISYSLYLWHYPLFAFYRILKVDGITFNKIYLILILFILSFFSYYFIEKKFRSINFKFKNIIIYIIVTLLFLTFTNFWVIKNLGLKERHPSFFLSNHEKDQQYHLLRDSKDTICLNKLDGCSFNTSSNKKVYLIGDSIMGSISNDLKNKLLLKNYQFNTFTMGDCLFFPGFNRIDDLQTNSISKKCNDDYFQKIKETISKDDNSIIIIGGMIRKYTTLKNFDSKEGCLVHGSEPWNHKFESIYKTHNIKDSFIREVSKFSHNNKVILIYPLPEICRDPKIEIFKKWLMRSDVWGNKINTIVSVSSKVFYDSTLSSFELLNSIRGKNIYRVYPHQLFCDKIKKDRCVANNDRHLLYSDSEHPSFKGVEMINELIMKEIKNIELEIN